MAKISIELNDALLKAIDEIIKKEYFTSREEFIQHAIRFLMELYGGGGVSLIEELSKRICPSKRHKKAVSELSPDEEFILELFGKSTFLYPLEIYSLALQEALKLGRTPLPKEKVFEIVEGLIKKGYLEKIKRGDEELIRIVKRVENEEE